MISRAAAVETGMHLEGVPEDTADQAPAPVAAEVPPALDLEAQAALAVAVVGGADK